VLGWWSSGFSGAGRLGRPRVHRTRPRPPDERSRPHARPVGRPEAVPVSPRRAADSPNRRGDARAVPGWRAAPAAQQGCRCQGRCLTRRRSRGRRERRKPFTTLGTWVPAICCSPPATAPRSRATPSAPASDCRPSPSPASTSTSVLTTCATPTPPGSWLLAPGSWLLAPGSWLLAPGRRIRPEVGDDRMGHAQFTITQSLTRGLFGELTPAIASTTRAVYGMTDLGPERLMQSSCEKIAAS